MDIRTPTPNWINQAVKWRRISRATAVLDVAKNSITFGQLPSGSVDWLERQRMPGRASEWAVKWTLISMQLFGISARIEPGATHLQVPWQAMRLYCLRNPGAFYDNEMQMVAIRGGELPSPMTFEIAMRQVTLSGEQQLMPHLAGDPDDLRYTIIGLAADGIVQVGKAILKHFDSVTLDFDNNRVGFAALRADQ